MPVNPPMTNFYPGASTGRPNTFSECVPIWDHARHTWVWEDFHTYTSGDWTLTETDAAATEALATGHGGLLLVTNTGADNDVTSIQYGTTSFAFASGRKAWFSVRFKASEATDIDLFLGLAATDTSPIASLPANYAAFVKDDDAATYVFKTAGSSTAIYNSGTLGTLVADTFVTLSMYYDGLGGLTLWKNDTVVKQVTGTAFASLFPTADLRITAAIQAGAAAAKTMTLDYLLAGFER